MVGREIIRRTVLSVPRLRIRPYSQDVGVDKPEIKPPGKVKKAAVKKYVGFLERFENSFEGKYPKAFSVYKLFKDGIKNFVGDVRLYYRVSTEVWGGKSLKNFTRTELECYKQMPVEMIRLAPIMIVQSIPMVGNSIFAVAYFFPRYLLCRHFWTTQQKLDFGQLYLNRRLQHLPNIVHYLEKHSKDIRDEGHKRLFTEALYKLENNSHPEVEHLLDMKPLFETRPFGLDYLSSVHKLHTRHLSKSMGFSTRKSRLIENTRLVHSIDHAMVREGISSLNLEDLQQSCFVRGLNAKGLEKEELEHYLKLWTSLSTNIDDAESISRSLEVSYARVSDLLQSLGEIPCCVRCTEKSYSLLLHSPVFLAYNQPTNIPNIKKHDIKT